ncbi:MAG: NmrA family protein [Bdellovibrionales bacterium CG10_big_fil_rev_8_21_14_0_10_45_34]|nr:MAG: NmrA family protein [Bdellovibrionales bacterium CG10_big_fil_rev_8_21_14_0_10_45_34]
MNIVVAGASGYIGREIILRLLEKFPEATITALSRSEQKSDHPRVLWKPCDLFSLRSLELALPKTIDFALYLVHSMGPTAQLDQGSFADYDLILADNFARSLKDSGLKQLIYLSGLIPEDTKLSLHLQSRLEMEDIFHDHALPATIFRAGLILGESGSSFQILIKLVKRLPIMICPRWTQTLTTPVDLETVLTAISSATSDLSHVGKTYDLAGCKPLTYLEMMRQTAKEMKLKRLFLSVPFFTPTLSRLWVSLITNSPRDLVYPLVESLEHPMLARKSHLFSDEFADRTYREILKNSSFKSKSGKSFFRFRIRRNTVRSVQRIQLPLGKNAQWVKNEYLIWLTTFLTPVIVVEQNANIVIFSLFKRSLRLIEMELSDTRSDPDRQILYITKGLLVSQGYRGRLEFRVVLNRRFVIAAIHDFKPALPWFIYKYTQAKLHLFVMKAFAKQISSDQS